MMIYVFVVMLGSRTPLRNPLHCLNQAFGVRTAISSRFGTHQSQRCAWTAMHTSRPAACFMLSSPLLRSSALCLRVAVAHRVFENRPFGAHK